MAKRFPDALSLIFFLIVFAQLGAYLLPPGEYTRERIERIIVESEDPEDPEDPEKVIEVIEEVYAACGDLSSEYSSTVNVRSDRVKYEDVTSRSVRVKNESFEKCEETVAKNRRNLHWYSALLSIPEGFEHAQGTIFFVLIIGGVVRLVRETGAIDALLQWAADRFQSRPTWLVAGMTAIVALGASTYGMSEELVAFAPFMLAMCIAVRLDAVVAIGVLLVGYACGYAGAALNPFSVKIAAEIADLDYVSAQSQAIRWCVVTLFLTVGIHHIIRYVARIVADPDTSLVADVDYSTGFESRSSVPLTGRLMAILLIFVSGILIYAVGTWKHDWYTSELSAVFLGVAILVAIAGRLGSNSTVRSFVEGAGSMAGVALIIGFAHAVHIVLYEGMVADTIVSGLAEALPDAKSDWSFVSPLVMLGVQTVVNFLIPSGSGQAAVMMPIMAPLASAAGVSKEAAVLAYQFGDGLSNMVVPTSAVTMALLAAGRIPYERWVRFVLPLLLKLYVVAGLAILGVVWWGF